MHRELLVTATLEVVLAVFIPLAHLRFETLVGDRPRQPYWAGVVGILAHGKLDILKVNAFETSIAIG